jgi:hypothetical protein
MKRQIAIDRQIQSLGQTISIKAQVFEKISNSSIDELHQLVPGISPTVTKSIIIENADKILNPKLGLPYFSDPITEAIIKTIGRPVFFVQNGKTIVKGGDIEKLKKLVYRSRKQLSSWSNNKINRTYRNGQSTGLLLCGHRMAI